jgi:hypothetical protein
LVIVPAIRVVVHDDDRSRPPEPRTHDGIDGIYEKLLI